MDEQVNPNEENNKDDLAHLEFDSLSPLEQDAANMHEMFMALGKAGFTQDQALKLVALLVDQPDVETVHFHFDEGMSEDIMDDLNDDE
jgi:hypothetical protein